MFQRLIILFLVLLSVATGNAQQYPIFTHADTLRGMLTPERTCYDVYYYDLHLKINPEEHSVSGYNVIAFKSLSPFTKMQIDLFKNLQIDSMLHGKTYLNFSRDSNAVFISFKKPEKVGIKDSIKIYYHGFPQIAKKPPWDGGFIWRTDTNGKTWVDVACEGTGASLWWPCKDHLSDKPDSMRMTFDVPTGEMCVSNGRLRYSKEIPPSGDRGGSIRYCWFVSVPIVNYDVTLNIGDYAHIHDYYLNNKDTLTLDYYVLKGNEQKAREHFKQVKPMLACYEKYFGKYPFYRDGYKLVETTYWGMEHQSCVAYGNHYKNNKFGFDFIIVHESAHEWWGNSVTCTDQADMWLHEAFATYAEALYVECTQDYDTAIHYLNNQKKMIFNKYPVIGPYGVNFAGTNNDNDEYYKGTWMLHTFRHVLDNDSLFFAILKGIQTHFAYSSTNSKQVIAYISGMAGNDYAPFFDQYLRKTSPPVFEYSYKYNTEENSAILICRWDSVNPDFKMPLKIYVNKPDGIEPYTIEPGTQFTILKFDSVGSGYFAVDTNEFYVIPKKDEN